MSVVTSPPSGTRDFLPQEMKHRQRIFAALRTTFEQHGFEPLDTPAFERIETLLGKYGEEGDKLIFKILRRGEHESKGEVDYALRYDLTVPLARVIADNRQKLSEPFRRYHIAPVWRADRPGKGRYREFYQCDIDIVGSTSRLCEAEVLTTMARAYQAVGLADVTFQLNSRKFLFGLLTGYGVADNLQMSATVAIDKLDKIGPAKVVAELIERGVENSVAHALGKDLEDLSTLPEKVKERASGNEMGRQGLAEVEAILQIVTNTLLAPAKIQFAPLLARGLGYYTGSIFEVSYGEAGMSLGGGGRYDDLLGSFAGTKMPAVGGSVGIERVLLWASKEQTDEPRSQVSVGVWNEATQGHALALTQELRAAGISAEIALQDGGFGKQLKKASQQKIPVFVMCGPDEMANGTVSFKQLATGEQVSCPQGELANRIKSLFAKM